MNLTKLFDMQRVLDERIEKEHPRVEGEDRLSKKILALQVELGELANEWRGFKFWSKNQEPRTNHSITKTFYSAEELIAEVVEQIKEGNPLLEEYVDCLHFILSIGLEFRHKGNALELKSEFQRQKDITSQFILLFNLVSENIWNNGEIEEGYGAFIYSFLELGEMLGFTWEQIEQAYISKNEVNHERQNAGY